MDENKKNSENDQSTHWSFSEFFFFNISRTNSKVSKVNQQSVLIFEYFFIFLKIWTGHIDYYTVFLIPALISARVDRISLSLKGEG